ncbi:calcium-binding protein, partial [Nitrosomonas sp. JL21]|nr:calcium-binding protein [Nitrosomonas sp. JL21]
AGVNGETITITGDGAVTTFANVENYVIEDDTTDARNVTILAADTSVTANSATDAVIFTIGALTYSGRITGQSAVGDTLSLANGANVSGGTIANVEALVLASGASVRISATQNQGFTGAIMAPGNGIGGETLIVSGDGAVTTLTNIENYVIEDDTTNARSVTILTANTNVTANSATDAVTFIIGALAYTGTITGQAAVDDRLVLSNGADISAGTIVNIEALTLVSGASVRLSVAQNQALTGTIIAPGSGVSGEKITIAGDGAVTVRANIETYELGDDSTNARTVTLNSAALTLIANNLSDVITVNAAALAQNAALTLGTSASSLIVTNLVGNLVATDLAGTLTVTTANAADNGISITTGSAACAVNVAAGAASDIVAINAAALGNNTMLTITSGGGAAGAVNITGLIGNLTVSNPISGLINIVVADNAVDDGIAIAAGAANLAISNVADGDTVTITGFIGSALTGAIAGTSGKFNIAAGIATNTITTGAGNDTFTFAAGTGLTSADTVNGGAGTDTVA